MLSIQDIPASQEIPLTATREFAAASINDHKELRVDTEKAVKGIKASLASSFRLVKTPVGTSVGELQEKWQFPSDHLPIGMGIGGINIASWNVLDAAYMDWVIEKNHQGLARSLIKDEHIYINGTKLTNRDLHTIRLVLEMVSHKTKPRDLIALQECSKAFVKELHTKLSANYKVIAHHGEALLINIDKFEVLEAKAVHGIFSDSPSRCVQQISLLQKKTKETLHIINAHLPGDPEKPGRFEFANYLAAFQMGHNQDTVLAIGDMNFNEIEMHDALERSYNIDIDSIWNILTPYPTNISPYVFQSKAIDHFFVYDPEQKKCKLDTDPDDLISELAMPLALLQGKQN